MTPGKKPASKTPSRKSQHVELQRRRHEHHGRCGQTPEHHDTQQRLARTDFLQEKVARHFKQKVSDEKYPRAQAVDGIVERQSLLHLQLRIADVDAIEIGDHVGDQQQRDQPPAHLREYRLEFFALQRQRLRRRRLRASRMHDRSPPKDCLSLCQSAYHADRRDASATDAPPGACSTGGSASISRSAARRCSTSSLGLFLRQHAATGGEAESSKPA